MRAYNGNLRRVTKPTAKKLFDAGKDVLFLPCNMDPETPAFGVVDEFDSWYNRNTYNDIIGFDTLYTATTFCDCNAETGRYLAFYVKISEG